MGSYLSIILSYIPGFQYDDAKTEQMEKMSKADGYIAALDQSGGSTPKALKIYGVMESEYTLGEESMYQAVHDMRTRIITSPSFNGDRTLAAILFENTMDREIEGIPTATFLWEKKKVIPLLKIDKGMEEEKNGAQIMKPMPALDDLLTRAVKKGIFGTKMRSFIRIPNADGIKAVVDQQFEVGKKIISYGLCPIIEPEVDINCKEKVKAEELLKKCLLAGLDDLNDDQKVMLKVTLPTKDGFYKECIDHPNCVRVVALSGGYPRDKANEVLARNPGMIASFSRALTEGLNAKQTKEEYDATLDTSITGIYEASKA